MNESQLWENNNASFLIGITAYTFKQIDDIKNFLMYYEKFSGSDKYNNCIDVISGICNSGCGIIYKGNNRISKSFYYKELVYYIPFHKYVVELL